MTLSPVFRSPEAVKALRRKGYMRSMRPSIEAQKEAVRRLRELLRDVVAPEYLGEVVESDDDVVFLQEHFFLILFHSLFKTLGCPEERLRVYALLNLCIKGIITSGDNLFDGEAKMALPLDLGEGARFASIMQMLCFDHLVERILEEHDDFFSADQKIEFRRSLLSRMAHIGTLEGSEEGGVSDVPAVAEMVDRVHRVRGGELFALAFVAPSVRETEAPEQWAKADLGIRHLGTAFQIVDDVTDFEFDMGRRSHNIIVAQVVHSGTADEKAALARIREADGAPHTGTLEECFMTSAGAILDLARSEAEKGFQSWKDVGFWFPPEDSGLFVRAIAGDNGDQRVRDVAEGMSVRD